MAANGFRRRWGASVAERCGQGGADAARFFQVLQLHPLLVPGESILSIDDGLGAPFMSVIQFEDLPNSSRAWVFGSDRTLDPAQSKIVMNEVDAFMHQWKAHGAELTSGRDWRYGRFLTVAVDQSTAGASGCSIDGLFRILKSLEPRIGSSLVGSSRVFFRDSAGAVRSASREEFAKLGRTGEVTQETPVFDPSVTSLGE